MNFFIDYLVSIPNWPFTVLASLIALIGGIYLFKLKRFSDAAEALRSAFAPEISILKSPTRTDDVRDILISAFDRHSIAVTNFSWYLNRVSKSKFNKAWQQYHSGHCFDADGYGIDKKERLFMNYFSIDIQSDAAEFALKHIYEILKFSK